MVRASSTGASYGPERSLDLVGHELFRKPGSKPCTAMRRAPPIPQEDVRPGPDGGDKEVLNLDDGLPAEANNARSSLSRTRSRRARLQMQLPGRCYSRRATCAQSAGVRPMTMKSHLEIN